VRPSEDLDLTWLLQQLNASQQPSFAIDRTTEACRTPRRNPQTYAALQFFAALSRFCSGVHSYFLSTLFPVDGSHGLDLSPVRSETTIFVPVLPLFENAESRAKAATESDKEEKKGDSVLPLAFANQFLAEEKRTMTERFLELAKVYPTNNKLVTLAEAKLLVTLLHTGNVCANFQDGVNYVENMLLKQLIAAVGKEVQVSDFNAYMRFHARKLYKAAFAPQPFSFAVRRPNHTPEGALTIEAQDTSSPSTLADPVWTIASGGYSSQPMFFNLDASTRVAFTGERCVFFFFKYFSSFFFVLVFLLFICVLVSCFFFCIK